MEKIAESMGINDGETLHELKHRIHSLTEENNLLLTHLEELKVFISFENLDKYLKFKTIKFSLI